MAAESDQSGGARRVPDGSSGARTVCFDLDGTLCTNTFGDYEAAEPFPWAIERVNDLARAGHTIVVFTARGTATGIDWDAVTRGQLERWGVRYDDLRFGKPSADVYVDDRAVHTSAWREADAFAVPGFAGHVPGPEELPVVPLAQRTSVSETGRTFGGRPFLLEAHAERARALATAAGIRAVPDADELAEEARAALAKAPADAELLFTFSISDVVSAAFVDTWEPLLPPTVGVSCRRLAQAGGGLKRFRSPGERAIAAATDAAGRDGAWPLQQLIDGSIRDTLGGRIAAISGDELALEPDLTPPAAFSPWLRELALEAGLEPSERALQRDDLTGAEETFIACLPFGPVPLATLDGERLGGAGRRLRELTEAWGRAAGVDPVLELAGFLGETARG